LNTKIDEIRAQVDIVEIIGQLIPLKRTGANYKTLCPFHSESSPSFYVSPSKQMFYCFGCKLGGDVIKFLMQFHGISFIEAVTELADKTGVSFSKKEIEFQERQKKDKTFRLFQFLEKICCFYERQLFSYPQALEYLKSRKIKEETIKLFRIGFAPPDWNILNKFLKMQDISISELEKLGLIGKNPVSGDYYDRFKGRIILPVFNQTGKIVGFGSRVLKDSERGPKYLNSSDSVIYKKGETLYGLYQAKTEIKKQDLAILVEGNFDVLSLVQQGIKNVVSPMGTSLTSAQAALLARFTYNIILFFDGDPAGIKSIEPAYKTLLKSRFLIKIALAPEGEDPDSLAFRYGKAKILEVIQNAQNGLDFLINHIAQRYDDSPAGKAKIFREIASILDNIKDPLERELSLKEVIKSLGIEEEIAFKYKNTSFLPTLEKEKRDFFDWPPEELTAMVTLLEYPNLLDKGLTFNLNRLFTHPLLQKMFKQLFTLYTQNRTLDLPTFLEEISHLELKDAIQRLLMEEKYPFEVAVKRLEDATGRMYIKRLKAQIKKIDKEMKEALETNNEDLWRNLYLRKEKIIKEITQVPQEGFLDRTFLNLLEQKQPNI
jgi:DNA primase